MSDYQRVAKAIEFIVEQADRQPGLAEIAAAVGLSPHHFQRLFSRWAGTSPKRFLQAITLERARQLLTDDRRSLLEASEALGFSSQSRLYDHFVQIDAVTPGEYRRRGAGLEVRFGTGASPFGPVFAATTRRGICALSFPDGESLESLVDALQQRWPEAQLEADDSGIAAVLEKVFSRGRVPDGPLTLAVQGTNFQLAVWQALLRIPGSRVASYGDIARAVGRPGASRAVGSAVGANPCAWLIPCHRVIRETGEIGGYRWGLTRKRAMLGWEAVTAS